MSETAHHSGTMIPGLCRTCATPFPTPAESCPECQTTRFITHPELNQLTIAHIDCDAFYASVEKRDNPELADKPVIIGGTSGRGVVTTACYIARKFGPRSAMPMFKATKLCPQAVVIRPNMEKYKRVSNQIREIFLSATPVIQPVSLDEAYLDLSDDNRLADETAAQALAHIAIAIEEEVKITVSIGLSYNKFLAKLASDLEKPRGYSIIGREEAYDFLTPLPVSKINGVGKATQERMERAGVHTIGDLQAMNSQDLTARFGKFGERLVSYANAEDPRLVKSESKSKSVSNETTFRTDLRRLEDLTPIADKLCITVAERLKKYSLAGGTVVLKLKTADFQTLTRNRKLKNPTQRIEILRDVILDLLKPEINGKAYRLLGVGVSEITPASEADPPDLFD